MTALAPAPETDRWPGLHDVPAGPRALAAARIARGLLVAAARRLEIDVVVSPSADPSLATGRTVASDRPTIVLHRPDEFYRRVGAQGLIGLGEGYQAGAWSSPDLARVLTVLAGEVATIVPEWMQRMRRLYVARAPSLHRNTETQTRGNIAHHYDLSNDLFATFLDPTLSYSAALFDTDLVREVDHLRACAPDGEGAESLATAQERKVDRLLDQAGVGEGTRLLEVGTGWGELAIRAARRGATVRTVTLSSEQQALARERVAAAGYADRVQVDLLDYRAVDGTYDAIVSVEMIEAVGHEFWRTYFEKLDRVLALGGRVALQAITMPHDRMLATRDTYTWINKYIFPGGFLPSVEAIEQVTRRHTTLRVSDRLAFGAHYAETLRRWDEAFLAARDRVAELGFDDTFVRMWHFYLEYSRAGFASGYLDVQQLTLTREDA